MRRTFMVVIATAGALSSALPASAATPGSLSPQQPSTQCQAYFGVPAGPEPLSACQWDMRAIDAGADAWAAATGDGVTVRSSSNQGTMLALGTAYSDIVPVINSPLSS